MMPQFAAPAPSDRPSRNLERLNRRRGLAHDHRYATNPCWHRSLAPFASGFADDQLPLLRIEIDKKSVVAFRHLQPIYLEIAIGMERLSLIRVRPPHTTVGFQAPKYLAAPHRRSRVANHNLLAINRRRCIGWRARLLKREGDRLRPKQSKDRKGKAL